MEKTILFIGGDYRIIKLAQMLRQDGFKIKTYGLEKSEEIFEEEKYEDIEKASENVNIIISSIPFSKDGINVYMPFSEKTLEIQNLSKYIQGKTLIAGNINVELFKQDKDINNGRMQSAPTTEKMRIITN